MFSHAELFFISKVKDGTLKLSKSGKVFNTKTGKYIGAVGSGKYPKISMARLHRKDIVHIQIHRLVWCYYKGPIPAHLEINHKDGVKSNPRLSNLELVTKSGNVQHAVKTGLCGFVGKTATNAKLTNEQAVRIRLLYKFADKWSKTNHKILCRSLCSLHFGNSRTFKQKKLFVCVNLFGGIA